MTSSVSGLDGLDFEVQRYQREDQTLQVLDKIVEYSKTIWIFRVLDIYKGSNFGGLESDMFISDSDFEFLFSDNVFLWPVRIILLCNFTCFNDALELLDHQRSDPHLFAN